MKRIWLVRHAQSMSQIDKSVSGVNPDLSPYGEDQARHLKSRLSEIKADMVLISPLTRAWRTYMLSEYEGSEVRYDQRLMEDNYNVPEYYSGVDFEKLPDLGTKDTGKAHTLPARERAALLLGFIEASNHSSFLLFGHFGIFTYLFNAFVRSSESAFIKTASQNTCVSLLEIDEENRRSVVFWNDFAHLSTLNSRGHPMEASRA